MRRALVTLIVAAVGVAACRRETRPRPPASTAAAPSSVAASSSVTAAARDAVAAAAVRDDRAYSPDGHRAYFLSAMAGRLTIRVAERAYAGEPEPSDSLPVVAELPDDGRDASVFADDEAVYVMLSGRGQERVDVWKVDRRRAPTRPELALSVGATRAHVGVAAVRGHLFYWRWDAATRHFEVGERFEGGERRRPELEATTGEGRARVHSMLAHGDQLVMGVAIDDPSLGERRVRFVAVSALDPRSPVQALFEVRGVSPVVDVVSLRPEGSSSAPPDLYVTLTRGEIYPRPASIGEKGGASIAPAPPQVLVVVGAPGKPLLRLSSGERETAGALVALARNGSGAPRRPYAGDDESPP